MAEMRTEEDKRIELQEILERELGSNQVFFQPPETLKMSYPSIRYVRASARTFKANDHMYHFRQGYTLTLIEYDPDSELAKRLLDIFPFSRIDSYYRSDGLNHTKMTIYF